MGYLLKEALKTLCGVNQWSYAVFWKFGHQNPKLLIWEECYYEPMTFSLPPQVSGSGPSEAPTGGWEAKDRVQMLIERMMTKAQIIVVGEGIIGRVAFTGDHEWIVSTSYSGHAHPPEVVNEVHHQFSAGIQTVAIIPVPLHGVVQLGSSIAIMEHLGFVNDVKSLILQVARSPGALFSRSSAGKAGMLGYPGTLTSNPPGNCQVVGWESLMSNSCKDMSNSSRTSGLVGRSSPLTTNTVDSMQTTASTLLNLEKAPSLAEFCSHPSKPSCVSLMKTGLSPRGKVDLGLAKAEVIPANLHAWLNQHAVACNLGNDNGGQTALGPTHGSCSIFEPIRKKISAGVVPAKPDNKWTSFLNSTVTAQPGRNGCSIVDPCKTSDATQLLQNAKLLHEGTRPLRSSSVLCSLSEPVSRNVVGNVSFQDGDFTKLEGIPLFNLSEQLLSGASGQRNHLMSTKRAQTELPSKKQRMVDNFSRQVMLPNCSNVSLIEQKPEWARASKKLEGGSHKVISTCNMYENASVQQLVRNDLLDILGADMTNNIIDGNLESLLTDGPCFDAHKSGAEASSVVDMQEALTDLGSLSEGFSESGIFSMTAVDNLLDAVVSGTYPTSKPSSDDNVSCKTSVTRISSSSAPSSSSLNNNFDMLNQEHKDSFGIQNSLVKAGVSDSGSLRSGCNKNGAETCSLSNSFYGSHISSWVDQGHSTKQDNTVSTGYSTRQDGMIKSNRKRLKPGENPRPRPKDRQMIQDRVKELREIVPNGGKCSIDALLERTIKHMLFLQSVSKHADKLKQIGGSKIINEEGRFLLKDNFERGATWAYEIGSESMVHPIIVEDLNPPRQMIVEMLCEEQGFFLEIADMIRGLGLTILKGVMETRNDKIWARFAVEADRDVTRVEIFMSLVRLLEETMESSPLAANAIDGKTPMVCQPIARATSATGGHDVLQ
ncbi:transcription factor LHW-like [Rhodamnia argentea]|uniref:Transcription factor LHW-like n=1 Tax=Rhodamnia argentea TaxID=178133 RepID=A0A8B8NFM2_9MYRT|nr:transcription factor LHW-like [Rhodamnia argentea]